MITLDKIIDKNQVKDNSIIVLKFENEGYQDFQKVANGIKSMIQDKKDVFILFLHKNQEIEVLPEKEMNKRGWYKNNFKPDKNVKVPKYDLLSEGYDVDKIKNER